MALRVNSENFETEVLKSELPVLADFYSDSCVPCKRLSPIISQLETERSDSLKVVKVNINFDSELAERFEVQAAPTLIYFKNGEEAARLRGAVKKAEIEDILN
ncbi:MAG: thioredoxin fold domain-containing protein [Clostridia bacterium]|nr:thioredoxin fold domain-containing protein [Clostridia bacterium]